MTNILVCTTSSNPASIAFFEAQLATGEYPHITKLFRGFRGDLRKGMERLMETFSGEAANDRRFDRGLKALLDGFEKRVS